MASFVASVGSNLLGGLGSSLGKFASFLRSFNHSASALTAVVYKTQVLFHQIESRGFIQRGLASDSFKVIFLAAKLQAEMYELALYLKGIASVESANDTQRSSMLW